MPPRPRNEPEPEPKIPFDPDAEPTTGVVEPPGLEVERARRIGAELEIIRLREQVILLQQEVQRGLEDDAPYAHDAAGSGHLDERLARVALAMSRIPKRGFNREQSYAFVAHSDVLDAVRPALAAEGVAFGAEMKASQAVPEGRVTAGGLAWCMWRMDVEFSLACWYRANPDAEGVLESKFIQWSGWAQDYSDKGGSKALTAAIKTFLIQTFLISTGDDPDESPADSTSRPEATPRQGQASGDLRAARNAALDWNQKLPQGKLSAIARKIAGNGVIMKIEDVAQLQRIAKTAAAYEGNPEGGEAWLRGDAPAENGEPEPAVEGSENEAEAPVESAAEEPEAEPEPLPAADSYDPPLSEDEQRQHALGIDPRPEGDL